MRFCQKVTAKEQVSVAYSEGKEIATELAHMVDKKLNDKLSLLLIEGLEDENLDRKKFTDDYWRGVKEVFDGLA